MNIAFILYDGITALDLIGVYDPITRLRSMGFIPELEWELCACAAPIHDAQGLLLAPTRTGQPLDGFDLVIVPGGFGSRDLLKDENFLQWLKTAAGTPRLASVCSGSLLLAACGFLEGKTATTHPNAREELAHLGVKVSEQRLVEDGRVITSGGVSAGIDLGLYLCQELAGENAAETIRRSMDYPHPILIPFNPARPVPVTRRFCHLSRKTKETEISVTLNLDGEGQHNIHTGLPFFDHMLTQIAVHGLFDLTIQARGDLAVDPHHTVEDVGLTLGQAFAQALGDRAGIVRMASADCPMDESLAHVVVDFSGRPYAILQAQWNSPYVGNIPTSLIPHFLESFAFQARCNLHAQVLYGRDDHHQAEALFKALARALDAAVRLDPRRAGGIPSSKGVL